VTNVSPIRRGARGRLSLSGFVVFAAASLIFSVGCGDGRPERVPVSGIVTIDGKPLVEGNIKFVPEVGRPSAGVVEQDGRFKLTCYDGNDGAIPGKHRVQVSASRILNGAKVQWFAPPHYADFRRSGLEVEITKPRDDLVIELTWGNMKGPFIDGS
jgi:hypothetical protein